MKKSLIAVAVLGAMSGAAFAQSAPSTSNVTLYGVVDASYQYVDGAESASKISSGLLSGSRWGLRGSEDLGGGLSGVFTLEQGISLDTGAASGFNRQAWLGVKGGFGQVSLGRQYHPGYWLQVNYESTAGASFSVGSLLANSSLPGKALSINPNSDDGRVNNSIAYISPDWSGFTVRAIYGMSEKADTAAATTDKLGNVLGLGADYKVGAFSIGGVYSQKDLDDNTAQTEFGLGAKYDFGFLTLLGTYQDFKSETAAAGDVKGNIYTIGALIPAGPGNVHVTYAVGETKDNAAAGKTDIGAKGLSLAYTYPLSKRTTVYGAVSVLDNDAGSAYGYQAAGDNTAPALGDKSNTIAIGVRHSF